MYTDDNEDFTLIDKTVVLPEGGSGTCRFYGDGSAALRVLGVWINFEGPYEPGDSKAVLRDYSVLSEQVDPIFLSDDAGVETRLEFVEVEKVEVEAPAFMQIPEDPYEQLETYTVEELGYVDDMDEVTMDGGLVVEVPGTYKH